MRGVGTRRLVGALALALFAAAGCASDRGTRTTLPTLEPSDMDPTAGFEHPPVLWASELLPPALVEGSHHEVDSRVETDGFVHLYRITSDFGEFEAHGDEMLRIRVREIGALATLAEMSKTEQFARAAANAAQSPFVATWNLLTDPVDSIAGIPIGAWRLVERASGMARDERGELEDAALEEFVGFEAKKRQIAYELGVDPYSSNETLQTELNRFAWAAYAGSLPSMFVPFVGDESQPIHDRSANSEARVNDLLRRSSPEDLRRLNRMELAAMGIPEPISDEFVAHSWYSPRHQTLIVDSLSGLDRAEDRAAFLVLAITADSEYDASFYERTVAVMRAYDEENARIEKIVAIEGKATGYTEDQKIVVPLPVDHAIWVRPTAVFARSFTPPRRAELGAQATEFLVTGTLSPKARDEIQKLGIELTEDVLRRLQPGAAQAGEIRR